MFQCSECEGPTPNDEDDFGEHVCDDCVQNRNERSWERFYEQFYGG